MLCCCWACCCAAAEYGGPCAAATEYGTKTISPLCAIGALLGSAIGTSGVVPSPAGVVVVPDGVSGVPGCCTKTPSPTTRCCAGAPATGAPAPGCAIRSPITLSVRTFSSACLLADSSFARNTALSNSSFSSFKVSASRNALRLSCPVRMAMLCVFFRTESDSSLRSFAASLISGPSSYTIPRPAGLRRPEEAGFVIK